MIHHILFFNLYALGGTNETLDQIIIFIANDIDVWIVAASLVVLFLLGRRNYLQHPVRSQKNVAKELGLMVIAGLVAWIVTDILKGVFGGPRPFELFENLEPLFYYAGGDSFPSGHATLFAAIGAMMYLLHKKIGILFLIIAVLISLARVISGIHFPVDIFAGWFIGISVSYIIYRIGKNQIKGER